MQETGRRTTLFSMALTSTLYTVGLTVSVPWDTSHPLLDSDNPLHASRPHYQRAGIPSEEDLTLRQCRCRLGSCVC